MYRSVTGNLVSRNFLDPVMDERMRNQNVSVAIFARAFSLIVGLGFGFSGRGRGEATGEARMTGEVCPDDDKIHRMRLSIQP